MTTIISNDTFQIIQNNNKFVINFSCYSESLIKSLTKSGLILGATVTDDYQTLMFKAVSLKQLYYFKEENDTIADSKSIPINLVAKMAADLGRQLDYLLKNYNETILGFNIENVFVINETDFIYLSSEFFREVNVYDKTIMITYPISTDDFYVAPNLLAINKLPYYAHYKTVYFSLGCLLLYALIGNNDFYEDYVKETAQLRHPKICEYLNKLPIKDTKLFGLIERCLVEEPENRSIVFI